MTSRGIDAFECGARVPFPFTSTALTPTRRLLHTSPFTHAQEREERSASLTGASVRDILITAGGLAPALDSHKSRLNPSYTGLQPPQHFSILPLCTTTLSTMSASMRARLPFGRGSINPSLRSTNKLSAYCSLQHALKVSSRVRPSTVTQILDDTSRPASSVDKLTAKRNERRTLDASRRRGLVPQPSEYSQRKYHHAEPQRFVAAERRHMPQHDLSQMWAQQREFGVQRAIFDMDQRAIQVLIAIGVEVCAFIAVFMTRDWYLHILRLPTLSWPSAPPVLTTATSNSPLSTSSACYPKPHRTSAICATTTPCCVVSRCSALISAGPGRAFDGSTASCTSSSSYAIPSPATALRLSRSWSGLRKSPIWRSIPCTQGVRSRSRLKSWKMP